MNKAKPHQPDSADHNRNPVRENPAAHVHQTVSALAPNSGQSAATVTTNARMTVGYAGLMDDGSSTVVANSSSSAISAIGISPKARRSRPLTAEEEAFIHAKASRLCRMWPFQRGDIDDVRQELRKAWLAVRDRFNPNRGSARAYFKTVVERSAGKLRDHNCARMRSPNAVDAPDLIQSLSQRSRSDDLARNRRLALARQSSLTHEDCVQLTIDIPELVKQLPEPLAQLCEKLKELSLAEISRTSGVPESTLSSRVSSIRKCFERLSLRDFL